MDKKPRHVKNAKKKLSTEIVVLLGYVVFFIFISIISPHFLRLNNLLNIGQHSAIVGVIATGMTLVLISGGIDISAGSISALTMMILSTTLPSKGGVFLSIVMGLGIGAACGFINGIVITRGKILPLIATLATASMFRGGAYLWTNGVTVPIINSDFGILGRGYLWGIPVSIYIMLFCFLVMGLILQYTPFGRMSYSVGGNAAASRLAGIDVNAQRLKVYVVCGITAGLAGVLTASQTGAGIGNTNEGMEMEAISAAILGGTSLHGGRGKMIGTLIGVLILVTLNNGMNLLGVPTFWKMVIKGAVLMIAVIIDSIRGGGYE